jgi:predicted glycosyl hydrolase (DUF1957 family)
MSVIRLEEALPMLESGNPVQMRYVSYDKRRKTGGKVKEITGIITKTKDQRIPAERAKKTAAKAQNHFKNNTRNFYTCIDGQQTQNIQTVHLPLILEVNGKLMML